MNLLTRYRALSESVGPSALRYTICATAVDKRAPKNVYGFAIGLTICMDILAAGPLTGASMNPARDVQGRRPRLRGLTGMPATLRYRVRPVPSET